MAGRLAERRFPTTGEPSIVYQYGDSSAPYPPERNVIGRLAMVTDAGGSVALSYDPRGNVRRHERTWDEFGMTQIRSGGPSETR